MQQGTVGPDLHSRNVTEQQDGLPVLTQLRLGLSRNYYNMASVLGLKRLQDYFQVVKPAVNCMMLKGFTRSMKDL